VANPLLLFSVSPAGANPQKLITYYLQLKALHHRKNLPTIPSKKNRVLSGMRPTGKLHIGHYFGALQNWVRLQNDPSYECFYFVADWHALTSDYADTSAVAQNTIEIVTDYLAAGLDPKKSVIFQQSLVPEHAELHLLLGMVAPLSWLERVPTYKEQIENVKEKDLHNYGFLGYPCLQTADIVVYSEPGTPLFVPVGEDQVSHVELSREIVRRFDLLYGKENWSAAPKGAAENILTELARRQLPARAQNQSAEEAAEWSVRCLPLDERISILANHKVPLTELLSEPSVLLTKSPRIPGLDGRKMSKSYGNAIALSESDDDIRKKTKVMVTDPARKRRTDPGNPDVCPVYDWHKLFSTEERDPGRLDWVQVGCRSAGIGCIECKNAMADNLIKWIAPVRERRLYYENKKKEVRDIIREGSVEARIVALKTMVRVRDAVFGKSRVRRRRIQKTKKTK
jgi:tryptophanyl-tRNA synthetase